MAFFLQHRAIQQHVKQELSRITDSPDEFSTYIPRTPEEQEVQESRHVETKGEPFTQIPGITLMQDCNGRRYYQVDWAGPNDPLNPKKWSTIHRVGATMLVCLVAFVATIASSIDSAVLTSATAEFGVSEVAESLATALFLVGMGLGALLLSPLSELLGRYLVYLVSLFIFGCWILGAALAPNFGAQLVFRFLAGFSASAPLTVAGGTVGDMWDPIEKTFALPLYAIPAFGGPVFGPVIGAYVGYDPSVDWRWAEWITLILVSATFTLILLLKKESFAPRILHYKAACFRKLTGNERFMTAAEASHASLGELMSKSFLRPFLLSTQPIVVAFTLYLTIVYIILFTFLDGYPFIFAETYGINEGLSNICFMGLFIGIMLSAILVPLAYRQTLHQLKQDGDDGSGKLVHRESRLFFAMVGAPALPIGLFWMGWTDYNSISIWSPLAASVLVGFSNICIFMSAYMYIIDSYEAYAASALTFNALTRYIAAGGMTVVGIPMYRNLGTHWTLTLLGCLGVLTVPIPYVLYRYGPSLRRRSQWAV